MTTLHYIGHASIRLAGRDGTAVYIDPYAPGDYSMPADIILVTHDHFDHNAVDIVNKKASCIVINQNHAQANGKYQKFSLFGVEIEAVQAYNKNHKKEESAGYIVTIDGISVYHCGDTSTTEQMAQLSSKKIDYVLLPVDGKYNMDVREAAECAKLIGARHSIPFHTSPDGFSQQIADEFEAHGKIVIKPGETIEL